MKKKQKEGSGLMESVTNTAKAIIGIPSKEEQKGMTIKIKKIKEKGKYQSPTKVKLRQTTNQGTCHRTIVDLTTPTLQKRKKDKTKQTQGKELGNGKKKTKAQKSSPNKTNHEEEYSTPKSTNNQIKYDNTK